MENSSNTDLATADTQEDCVPSAHAINDLQDNNENSEAIDQQTSIPARHIRSFVRRAGRLTPGQSKALSDLIPQFGVAEQPQTVSSQALFGDQRPLVVEIGFGNGDALAWMAQQQPDHGFIGLEVHRPGVGHALRTIKRLELTNARVLEADAVEFLKQRIAPASLAGIRIYFPDPWHKKRHNKRRLIQAPFVELAVSRLQPGGVLHLATDWQHYAEQMMTVCQQHAQLDNMCGTDCYAERPSWRPVTRFENRGISLGHGVWDLLFQRQQDQ